MQHLSVLDLRAQTFATKGPSRPQLEHSDGFLQFWMGEEYNNWALAISPDILYFRGPSGSGKTLVATHIVERLDQDDTESADIIAYFCSENSSTAKMVLRSVILQLAQGCKHRLASLSNAQKD